MKGKKRWISLILMLVLICQSLVSVPIYAAEEEDDIYFETTYVNPLYANVLSEEDLRDPLGISMFSSSTIYDTLEGAGAEFREQMKVRTSDIVVMYQTPDKPTQELFSQIKTEAMKHTGNPLEGDYLKWQYGGYKAQLSGKIIDGVYILTLTYAMTYYTTWEQEQEVDQKIPQIMQSLNLSNKTDLERIRDIYKYVCDHVTYDYEHLEDKTYLLKHSAYAAVVQGCAVCQGYALMLYRMLLSAGIDNRIVTGMSGEEGHAWNLVNVNGTYYNVDSTWDAGKVNYSWFLKGEDSFEQTHVRGQDYITEDFLNTYPVSDNDFTDPIPTATPIPTETPTPIPTETPIPEPTETPIPEPVEDGVIGAYSFAACDTLTEVRIKDTIKEIKEYAFADNDGLKNIYFCGAAPIFGEGVFRGVTANAYYPVNDESWTGEVLQNYGGSLTWIMWDPETGVIPTPVPEPSETPVPTPSETPVPTPTETPVPTPSETPVPTPTETPVPAPTETPVPTPTETPVPTPSETPVPTPTETPVPTPTETPVPTPTQIPEHDHEYDGDGICVVCGEKKTVATPVLDKLTLGVNSIQFSWKAVEGADYYRVFRKENGSTWKILKDVNTTSYTDTAVTNGSSYIYTVRCVSSNKTQYTSNVDQNGLKMVFYAAPVLEKISNEAAGVSFSWRAVSGISKYRVYRKKAGGGWTGIADVAGTSYTDKNAVSDTTYFYTVRCIGSDGSTCVSSFYSPGKQITYYEAPEITAVSNETGGVKLAWKAVSGISKYRVYRKIVGGSWSGIADVAGTAFTDKNAVSGTSYYYTVRCIGSDGNTCVSSFRSPGELITYYAAPVLTGVVNETNGVTVKWNAVAGVSGYRVFRKTAGGGWTTLGDTEACSYKDTKTVSGTTYYYTVRCLDESKTNCVSGFYSPGKSIRYLAAPVITGLTNTGSGVKIVWGKVQGAEKYRVFRKTNGGPWTKAADTTAVSYTDSNAKSDGTKYTYTVRCISADGASFTSNFISPGNTIVYLSTPVISSVTNPAAGRLRVTWNQNTSAAGYQIQYADNANFSGAKTVTIRSNSTVGQNLSNLLKGSTYYVRMRSFVTDAGTNYVSSWSSIKSKTLTL